MRALRSPFVVYTAGRFVLFLLLSLLLWSGAGLLGYTFNGLPLLLSALLLSSVASFFLLASQRQELALRVAAKRDAKTADIAARRARLEDDSAAR